MRLIDVGTGTAAMRSQKGIGIAAAVLMAAFVAPGATQAQRGAGASAGGRTATSLHVQAPARARGSSIQGNSARKAAGINTTGSSFAFDNGNGFFGDPITIQNLLNPVPTPGFSFDHLFALNQNLALMAFVDPATQVRLAVAERVARSVPTNGGGAFLIDGGGAYGVPMVNDQPQAQQPIIVLQQPAQQTAAAPAPAAEPPAEASEPLPDEGEFTLVLRDGTQIAAAAFTHRGDSIVYITPAGNRRSLAAGELDAGATVRVNQERGTPLQLPL
jgi:hypothetical protein